MTMKKTDCEAGRNIAVASSEVGDRKLRVLLIYQYRLLFPSIRVCGHCQLEWLAEQEKLEYRAVRDMALKVSDMNWADVVVLGRTDSWFEDRLARLLRRTGKYIAYILDDDLLNISPEISSASYYRRRDIRGYIRDMIDLSDAIISPSPLLLKKYATNGKKGIQIEEPAIHPVQYSPRKTDGPIRIGFAGSIDRTQDIEVILKQTLMSVKEEYGDRVAFEFFGAIPRFAEALGARRIPYTESYDDYRRTLNELQWDIGLAPMPDTPFHACKHYNKFSEYAAAGIVGVFSNVQPYTRLSAFADCAILCENTPESWTRALRELIEDADRRERYRRRVIECAKGPLSIPASAAQLEAGLPELKALKSARRIRHTWLGAWRAGDVLIRLFHKLRRDGLVGAVKVAARRARGILGR